jgi:hypothetical protein
VGIAGETTEVVSQPAHGLSLRRNFAWTVLGNVTYAACQWGMLVALAKLGSPEMVGQFALGLAIGAPVPGRCPPHPSGTNMLFTLDAL